jgi:hypothetical protein
MEMEATGLHSGFQSADLSGCIEHPSFCNEPGGEFQPGSVHSDGVPPVVQLICSLSVIQVSYGVIQGSPL